MRLENCFRLAVSGRGLGRQGRCPNDFIEASLSSIAPDSVVVITDGRDWRTNRTAKLCVRAPPPLPCNRFCLLFRSLPLRFLSSVAASLFLFACIPIVDSLGRSLRAMAKKRASKKDVDEDCCCFARSMHCFGAQRAGGLPRTRVATCREASSIC